MRTFGVPTDSAVPSQGDSRRGTTPATRDKVSRNAYSCRRYSGDHWCCCNCWHLVRGVLPNV